MNTCNFIRHWFHVIIDHSTLILLKDIKDVSDCVPKLTLTGYTAAEVDQIFTYLKVEEKFDLREVKKLCGCNPLLISCLHGCNNMVEYEQKVESEIDSFISDNLSIVKDVNCVTDFFSAYKWDNYGPSLLTHCNAGSGI